MWHVLQPTNGFPVELDMTTAGWVMTDFATESKVLIFEDRKLRLQQLPATAANICFQHFASCCTIMAPTSNIINTYSNMQNQQVQCKCSVAFNKMNVSRFHQNCNSTIHCDERKSILEEGYEFIGDKHWLKQNCTVPILSVLIFE
jgi:hypothetical protein